MAGNQTVQNGDRDPKTGHFLPGNQLARGHRHPRAAKACELRERFFEAIDPERFAQAVAQLLDQAANGNVAAFKELCDRLFDTAHRIDDIARADGTDQVAERRAVAPSLTPRRVTRSSGCAPRMTSYGRA